MLATRLWVGNKRLQGDLSKIIEAYEENSFIDSGLRKKERREESCVKHWKKDGQKKQNVNLEAEKQIH